MRLLLLCCAYYLPALRLNFKILSLLCSSYNKLLFMKTIGLIGGISWHATAKYYGYINQAINDHFGDNTNPPLLLYNMNQSRMHQMQKKGDWPGIAGMVLEGAQSLEKAGAEFLLICSNTTHKVLPMVQQAIHIPFLHIGDATAQYIKAQGFSKAGFIGTRFGMEDPFLTDYINSRGVEIVLPESESSILELHRIIHEELTYNKVTESSKQFVSNEIGQMKSRGAQGIILGCTEFSLMFDEMHNDLPVFDTVKIHALAAVAQILSDEGV